MIQDMTLTILGKNNRLKNSIPKQRLRIPTLRSILPNDTFIPTLFDIISILFHFAT